MQLLALWLGFVLSIAPQAPDADAIAAYRAGELANARSLWLELVESDPPRVEGFERARVLYDLGNVAARRGEWLEAVGWYAASLRLRPRDADAFANLEYARLQAGLPPADRGDLLDTLERLLTRTTRGESEWLALAALLPLALTLLGEALRGGVLWRRLSIAALVLALLGAAPWVHALLRGERDELLVIAPKGSALRSEPRHDAEVLARPAAGEILLRIDELPGWVRVRGEAGERPWVRSEDVFALRR